MKIIRASLILLCNEKVTEEEILEKLDDMLSSTNEEIQKKLFDINICLLQLEVNSVHTTSKTSHIVKE